MWNATGGYDGAGGFEFDGVDDYVNVPDASVLDVDYVTLAAWINVDSFRNDMRIVSKEYGTTDPYSIYTLMLTGDNEDNLEMRMGLVGQTRIRVVGNATIPKNVWVHVAATFDGSQVVVYINGQADTVVAASGTFRKNDQPVRIGASEFYGRNFDGAIDDARIYPYAVSGSQIAALYSSGPDVIKSSETSVGDDWQARVTPFSASEVGSTYQSNTVTIVSAE